jgi:hypothetical protein
MQMSFEAVNATAQVATLIVITATAVAAIVQLRHVRTSNEIALLTKLHDTLQSPDFVEARHFVGHSLAAMLRDPDRQASLGIGPPPPDLRLAILLGNFYENIGMFVRLGIVDRATVCELWNGLIRDAWKGLSPMLALLRRQPVNFDIWENFEYLAMLAEDWVAQHPRGTYPAGARRLALPSPGSSDPDATADSDGLRAAKRADADLEYNAGGTI